MRIRDIIAAVLVALISLFWGRAAQAQATPFYKEKTIRIIVGFNAGGLYDQYALIISRHMPKYIP